MVVDEKMKSDHMQKQALGIDPWMIEFRKDLPVLPEDPLSNAEPEKIVTTQLVWDVEASDFKNKVLTAKATYTYNNLVDGNNKLVLDITEDLEINFSDEHSITVNGDPASYNVSQKAAHKPYALTITIPSKKGLGEVSIAYKTSPKASGIFWVDKQYTEGKEHPLLYTLFEATEGASAIPGQHTPRVRISYEINAMSGDKQMMVLSSVSNNPKIRNDKGVYSGLRMNRAVPLYLVSLHVGNFTFKPYEDGVTGVYSEDAMIDKSYENLKQLPAFMKAAEEVCGPYNWGSYCPIILCNAFPYMAMEHPCASTCGKVTLEQLCVVPHELAHSWTGNDITNCNWQQFFWNEGWTTFVEFLICEKIWGTDYASMIFIYTMQETLEAMNEFRDSDPDVLKLCSSGIANEFTRIPYGKGALFFFMLQEVIEKKEFAQFIQDYMKVFYQNTMSDERFLAFLEVWLGKRMQISDFDSFKEEHQINAWLYGTEIPDNAPEIKSELLVEIDEQANKALTNKTVSKQTIEKWDISTQLTFLSRLESKATSKQLIALDAVMGYTNTDSISLKGEWALLCAMACHFTDETKKLVVDYIINRNSVHEANKITMNLCKSVEGTAVANRILHEEEGRLFTVTKDIVTKWVKAAKNISS